MIEGYKKLPNGVIKQTKIFNEIMHYDNNYIKMYEDYGEVGLRMSYLRLGNIIGTINRIPVTLLDVGYGSGDFLTVFAEDINNKKRAKPKWIDRMRILSRMITLGRAN